LVQTPTPGFLLTATAPIANVVIKATDAQGNSAQVAFNVMLVDTVPPMLTVDTTLFTSDYDIINSLYNQADRILAYRLDEFDAKFPYEKVGLAPMDSSYYKEWLVIMTSPGYAKTGEGGRTYQWIADSLFTSQ
jgi:hypothetical protein